MPTKNRYRKKSMLFLIGIIGSLLVFLTVIIVIRLNGGVIRSIADDGNILWYNQPSAEYYEGKYDRTYYTYVDSDNCAQIRFYDSYSKMLSQPTLLKKWDKHDDHSSPSICILQKGDYKGVILCAYSCHNSPLNLSISRKPEDISGFDEIVIDTDDCTYPRLIQMDDGSVVIVYRKRIDAIDNLDQRTETLYFIRSWDGGRNWTAPYRIIDIEEGQWVYAGPIATMDEDICFGYGLLNADTLKIEDVKYIEFNVNDYSTIVNGIDYSLPIHSANCETVIETSGTEEARVWDIKISDSSNPVLVWMLTDGNETEAFYAEKNDEWYISRVASGKIVYYPSGIVIDEENTNIVAISVEVDGVSEIEEWLCSGTYTWRCLRKITDKSTHNQYRPQYIKNYSDDFRLMWLTGDNYTKWTDYDTQLWGYFRR